MFCLTHTWQLTRFIAWCLHWHLKLSSSFQSVRWKLCLSAWSLLCTSGHLGYPKASSMLLESPLARTDPRGCHVVGVPAADVLSCCQSDRGRILIDQFRIWYGGGGSDGGCLCEAWRQSPALILTADGRFQSCSTDAVQSLAVLPSLDDGFICWHEECCVWCVLWLMQELACMYTCCQSDRGRILIDQL